MKRLSAAVACAFAGSVVALGASPADAAAACANEAIRESQGATHLPDCRAFEKVTPAYKGGVDIVGAPLGTEPKPLFKSSPDGERFMFASQAGFAGAEGSSWPNSYLSVRGSGWVTRGLTPPQRSNILNLSEPNGPGRTARIEAATPDLSVFGLTTRFDLLPGASKDVESVYVRDIDAAAASQYQLASPEGPTVADALMNSATRPGIVGASEDLRHVVFYSAWPLTADAPGQAFGGSYLYLWGPSGLELISRGPDNSVLTSSGGGFNPSYMFIPNAVSPDGTHVYFRENYNVETGSLFVRDTTTDTTTAIAEAPSLVFATSPDSDRMLYSRQVPDEPTNIQLAIYDADANSSEVLAANLDNAAPLAASSDLSRVYFLSKEELVAGQPPLGGARGIYLWDEGELSYVATLAGGDPVIEETGAPVVARMITARGGWRNRSEVGASADGSALALHTTAKLTEYDNEGTTQVYVYDADASTPTEPALECASCPASSPSGGARLSAVTMSSNSAASLFPWVLPRRGALSDEGAEAFFQSPDSLVPADANGRIDVYAWRGGEAVLVSSGTDGNDAEFVDSSASGDAVFFMTRGRLLASDRDDLLDVYSSTVDGGFVEPPPPPQPCEGSACQGQVPVAPGVAAPSSATLHGPGNAVSKKAPCAKLRKQASRKAAKAKRVGPRQAKKLRAKARTLRSKAKRCQSRKGAGR